MMTGSADLPPAAGGSQDVQTASQVRARAGQDGAAVPQANQDGAVVPQAGQDGAAVGGGGAAA